MGLPNFLVHVLRSSGRVVDLIDYCSAGVDGTENPLRIAVDVSSWIHGACQGHSDVLASDKHLSNYGRAALLLEAQQEIKSTEASSEDRPLTSQNDVALLEFVAKVCTTVVDRLETMQRATNARLLVVFDGASPPIKSYTVDIRRKKRKLEAEHRDRPVDENASSPALERRILANRRAGAGQHYDTVVEAVIVALRSREIPFLVAPYEADPQLAFLQLQGHVDLIVVDDSDLIAYGLSTPALYKLSANTDNMWTRGILLRKTDLAARIPGGGCGKGSTVALDFLDFSPAMLACLFASLGCDYCPKLTGIGTSAACNLVRAAFFPSRRNTDTSPLERLQTLLLQTTWKRNSMSDEDKNLFRREFLAAVFMFRHAIVFDPVQASCRSLLLDHEADPELVSYEPYAQLLRDPIQRAQIIGHHRPSRIATYIAEGWICGRSLRLRQGHPVPPDVTRELQEYESSLNVTTTDGNALSEMEARQHHYEEDDNPELESQLTMIHNIR